MNEQKTTTQQFEECLQVFYNQRLPILLKCKIATKADYEFVFFPLFEQWSILRSLQRKANLSEKKMQNINSLMEEVDQLDDSINRPISDAQMRVIGSHPLWSSIQRKAKELSRQN